MNKKALIVCLSAAVSILASVSVGIVAGKKGKMLRTAEATECSHTHVNHYDRVEPTLETSGVAEYWVCCECHKSFKDSGFNQVFENTDGNPTDSTDGRYLAPLGEATEKTFIGDLFYNSSASLSLEAAPEGYAFTKVYELASTNIRNIFDNQAVVDGFKKISFGLKTASKWFSIRGDWAWSGNSWKIFELVKNEDGTWNIYGATAGNALALKHSNISNRILSANSGSNDDSILNATCESDTCYVTNFRVMYDGEFDFVESAHVSTSASVSALEVPAGYGFDTVYEISNSNFANILNTSANVEGLSMIAFGVKTASGYVASHGWSAPGFSFNGASWKIFELVNTGSDTWNIYVENTSNGYNNGLELKGSFSGLTLSEILAFSSDPFTCYITNLIVLRDSKLEIAEYAVASSESVLDMNSAFLQFKHVSKKSLPETQGQPFIVSPDVSGVAHAEFAFMTKNRAFCDNTWGVALAKETWWIARFTINSATDVSCSIYSVDGTVKFSYLNKSSFAAALPYYNYSGDDLMEFYSTEIRASVN